MHSFLYVSVLDLSEIEKIKTMAKDDDNRDTFPDMVESFLDESRRYIETICLAIDQKDEFELRNASHSIRTEASMFPAPRLLRIGGEIENSMKTKDWEHLKVLKQFLLTIFQQTEDEIKKL